MSLSAKEETSAPRRLGRYELVRRLPGGGMTEVYLARVSGSVGPERLLVLKVLPRGHGRTEAAEARFLEEAIISLSLAHGNVTTTFETGRAKDGTPFLVMEYVHGSSLREMLDAGPLPPPLAVLVAREVSRALRYTHTFKDIEGRTSPIVHLDVTPENVLVSMAGHVKLTDFGIARAASGTGDGTVFGKAAYTAPEILGRGDGGPAADLWSLGCVLYEMVAGRAPHKGACRDETLAKVRAGDRPEPISSTADLSGFMAEALDDLVRRLLEPDPGKRLSDAAEVERALTSILTRVDPLPTEADLTVLMASRFQVTGESGRRHRLRSELEAAGRSFSGSESTAELLQEGTVPLVAAEGSPAFEAGIGEAPREGSSRGRAGYLVAAAVLVLVLPAALLLWPDAPSAGPEPHGHDPLGEDAKAVKVRSGVAGVELPGEARVEEASTSAEEEARSADTGTEASRGQPSRDLEPTRLVEGSDETSAAESVPASEEGATAAGDVADAGAGEEAAGAADEPGLQRKAQGVHGGAEGSEAPRASDGPPDLKDEPSGHAVLQINAYPYARVLLDGETDLGTTPLRDVVVPAGARRLTFTNPELGLEREVDLELEGGEERVVGLRLDR